MKLGWTSGNGVHQLLGRKTEGFAAVVSAWVGKSGYRPYATNCEGQMQTRNNTTGTKRRGASWAERLRAAEAPIQCQICEQDYQGIIT